MAGHLAHKAEHAVDMDSGAVRRLYLYGAGAARETRLPSVSPGDEAHRVVGRVNRHVGPAPGSGGRENPRPERRDRFSQATITWKGQCSPAPRTRKIIHWSKEMLNSLGKAPDQEVASRLGVALRTVRAKRKSLGIPAAPREKPRQVVWTPRMLEDLRRMPSITMGTLVTIREADLKIWLAKSLATIKARLTFLSKAVR